MDGGEAIHIAWLLEYLWINLIDNKKIEWTKIKCLELWIYALCNLKSSDESGKVAIERSHIDPNKDNYNSITDLEDNHWHYKPVKLYPIPDNSDPLQLVPDCYRYVSFFASHIHRSLCMHSIPTISTIHH